MYINNIHNNNLCINAVRKATCVQGDIITIILEVNKDMLNWVQTNVALPCGLKYYKSVSQPSLIII
jgi:hypothetical protein